LHPPLYFKDGAHARTILGEFPGAQGDPISMLMAYVSLRLFTAEVFQQELPLNVEMGHIALVVIDAVHAHVMEV
jgi:hypothetical protein